MKAHTHVGGAGEPQLAAAAGRARLKLVGAMNIDSDSALLAH